MASVLKGGKGAGGRSVFRSSLVIVQFGLSLAMIVSTLVVLQQLYFMQNKELGFNKDSPVTYWLLTKWLESFAYRIDINLLIFVLGALIAMSIALATISYHAIRSARANPVKSLRHE